MYVIRVPEGERENGGKSNIWRDNGWELSKNDGKQKASDLRRVIKPKWYQWKKTHIQTERGKTAENQREYLKSSHRKN